MRTVEDCYWLTVCLGSPRLKAWRDTAQAVELPALHGAVSAIKRDTAQSVELPALHGAVSAIKADLLAVGVILFGQSRGRACPLLRSRLGDPISLSSESVFKGRGGASVAPSS